MTRALLMVLALTLFLTSTFPEVVPLTAGPPRMQLYVQPRLEGGGVFLCPTIPGGQDSTCSTNWSGYVDLADDGGANGAFGSWIVPSVSCPESGETYAALWVGIDGYDSNTVEQTGVLAECDGGTASYWAWYEYFPSPSVAIASVRVSPGDTIDGSVTFNNATQEFTTFISSSGGGSFSISRRVAIISSSGAGGPDKVTGAARTSAEWIVERPLLCRGTSCTLATLANFGTADLGSMFTGSKPTNYASLGNNSGPIGSFPRVAVSMSEKGSGAVVSQPSQLTPDGTSFRVFYALSSPSISIGTSSSSTSLSCIKVAALDGPRGTCIARVTGDAPTGTVNWSSSGSGRFSSSACGLSSGVCFVRFFPASVDSAGNITAVYLGDQRNSPSIGVVPMETEFSQST